MRVRRQSYGNKLASSLVGAVLGIIMFLASFVALYLNEGRENLGKIAAGAKEVTSHSQAKTEELICFKGTLDADIYAKDTYLIEDDYLYIERIVEMYGYEETKHTDKKDNLGGSSTITESYTYQLKWTSSPLKSTNFKGDNSERPTISNETQYNSRITDMPQSITEKATSMHIGDYSVNEDVQLSGASALSITASNSNLSSLPNSIINNQYILQSSQEEPSFSSPKLGDIRISYKAIKANKSGIIFGAFSHQAISKFVTPKNKTLLRYFSGVDTKAEAVSILEKEHKTMTWILRLVGFLLMFLGLVAMSNPISEFVSVIPIFSKMSKGVFGIIAFIVSLVLTTLTVLLSIILHNFWAAIAVVVLLVIIIILAIARKRKNIDSKKASKSHR